MRNAGLPPGWRDTSLGALGSFFRGRGGTKADEEPNGMPCIRYGDLYTHHDCIVRSFASSISLASTSSYTLLQQGDVVFAGSGETFEEIGKAAAYCEDAPAYAGADTIIFRPGPDLLPNFAGYAVNSESANAHKSRMGQGSSVIHIGSDHLSQMPFRLPPREQQQRIAEILSTVGEAIEQTEALIAKTQQIKAGLMHDLFTRGVTADGQLRPPREEAPQLYKDSPLGWIPKEWDARACAEVTDMIAVGIVIRPAQYYVEDGVPAFRSANIREDGIDPSDLVFISPESNALLAKSQARRGDVLSVRTGYPGTSAVVPDEFAGANCVDILISRPTEGLNSDFLAAWINSPFGKEQVLRKQGGLAQQHFNVGELRELVVALPEPEEQERIVTRLQAVNSRVQLEASMARKYQAIKAGLMQDLLTGRISVVAESSTEPREVAANV